MIGLVVLSFVNAAVAQLPWSNITLNGSSTSMPTAILRDGAVMQFPRPDATTVVIVPTQPLTRVMLRRDCGGAGEAYMPHLMGLKVDAAWLAARGNFDWYDIDRNSELRYPGLAFAPLVGHWGWNVGTLVADLQLRPCRVLCTKDKLALEYEFSPPLPKGEAVTLKTMVASATATTGREAMGTLVRAFTDMVPDDGDYSQLQTLNGYINVQLEDQDKPFETVARLWAEHSATFGRVQVWGWTSNKHPTAGEETSCCLMSGTWHARYAGLPSFLRHIGLLGTQTALYFRGDDPRLDEWLNALGDEEPRYIDVAGFRANVRASYGPPTTIIEGVTTACKHAGLVSGSITGGTTRIPGGSRAYESPVPWFGALVFSSSVPGQPGRPKFVGDSNYDWAWTTEATQFRTYRAAFSYGLHLDLRNPAQPIIEEIVAEWKASDFWARRPQFLDVMGLSEIPSGAGITRFRDQAGRTLLAVDRYYDATWATARSCRVDGTPVTLPGKRLAIVEVE